MAYAPRQDGLNDVVLDDGTRIPSSLSAQQLEAMGHSPLAPPGPNPYAGLPPNAVAGPGGGSDEAAIANAFANPQSQPQTPASVFQGGRLAPGAKLLDPVGANGKPLPDFATGVKDLQAQAPQTVTPANDGLVPIGAGRGEAAPLAQQRSGGGVVKVKGGDTRASFVRQPGEEVPDDVKSDMVNNAPEQLDLATVQNGEDREKQRLDIDSALQTQQQQVDQAAARRAKIDGMLQQKQQLIDQRDRETEKLTPQSARQVWEDKGTLAQLFAGLSIVTGGYLQGLQGRANNPGLDMINNSIRDEVNDQRAKYDAAQKKGQEVRNDYSQALALYGTPEAAALDLEMRRNGLAAKIIQNHGEQITDREKQQAAFQAADQLRQQRGELKQKLFELEHGKVLQENWVNVPDRYVGTGPQKLKPEARERLVHVPGYGHGFVVAAPARDAFQKSATAAANALDIGNLILSKLPKNGGPVTDLNTRKEISSLQDRALTAISAAEQQGVVTKADAERATATLADPNAILTDGGSALRATMHVVRTNLDGMVRDSMYADPDATTPMTQGAASSFKPGL